MTVTYPYWAEIHRMTPEQRREYVERYIGNAAVAIDESFALAVLKRDCELEQRIAALERGARDHWPDLR